MGKDQEQLKKLDVKFDEIQVLRDRINNESEEISTNLKKFYAQRKALSPVGLTKNIKSISSFLDNFSRMMQNLSSKLGSLTSQISQISANVDNIAKTSNAMKR